MPTTIQSLITDLRDSKGWTQEEMAVRLTEAGYPLTRMAVSHIEVGRRGFTARLSVAYRAVFDLSGDDLAGFLALVDAQFPPEDVEAA